MLYLIGIGLKVEHLTLEALETIKKCDALFLESYTSDYTKGNLKKLEKTIGKKFKKFGRKEIEEETHKILDTSLKNNIGLMIFGNPLTATTHVQLLLDAKEKGVKTKVIPGISITNLVSKSGLDEYRFGRTVTICYHEKRFEPDSFYEKIKQNQSIGLHTLCLLDIKKEENKMMNCREAIELLEKIASNKSEKTGWEYLALLWMGNGKEKIIFGKEKILKTKETSELFPQSLIVIGKLTQKEKEALEKFGW